MSSFSRRLIYILSNKIRQIIPGNSSEKKTIYNFSKLKKSPFNIKPESSLNAYLSDGCLELCLKKGNNIAWTDIPNLDYEDQIIDVKFRLDSLGGYAAAGIVFRVMDEDSCYMALVSGKGYFRLDAVRNNSPKALVSWTEISDFDENNINMKIIAYDAYLIFIVNNKWVAEISDESIISGSLGFVLASYEETNENDQYACKASVENLSVDTRLKAVDSCFNRWTDELNINAEYRLLLAETFAVMGEYSKSLDQVKRAWKRRDEAIRGVSTDYEQVRTKKELLLAARMSFCIGYLEEAENFIDSILQQWEDSPEGKLAYTEKIKILYEAGKYAQLKDFILKNSEKIEKDIYYYATLAGCYWNLKEYKESAAAWNKAFNLNKENGVYAANAANAYEIAGKKKEALKYFITAVKIFLNQDNAPELAAIMPKLLFLGKNSWEARALSGKWAFSIEDYENALQEFDASEKLRRAVKPQPEADPAVFYLWGLIFFIKGKNKSAVRMLEKAVKLAPDYELFKEKLEEIKNKCK